MMTLGSRIKEYRLKRGFTQNQMAEKLNMTEANFSSYERDKSKPPSEKLSQIASVLGVSSDYLLFGDLSYLDEINSIDTGIKQSESFESALKIFAHYLIKYKGQLTEEKAINLGIKGLTKAYEQYTPSKGAKFTTFLDRYIENEMLIGIQDKIRDDKKLEDIQTIAAHHEGEDWTEEELEEIEQFKEFVRSKRKQQE